MPSDNASPVLTLLRIFGDQPALLDEGIDLVMSTREIRG
jgi:hypothetical protein